MNQSNEDPPRILNMIIAIYSTAPRSEHQFAALFRQLAVSDCGPKVPTLGRSIKVPGLQCLRCRGTEVSSWQKQRKESKVETLL